MSGPEAERRIAELEGARLRAETALRDAEERLRTVVSCAPIIVFALDQDGTYTRIDGEGVKAAGLRSMEIVGQSAFSSAVQLHGVADIIRRALAGESACGGCEINGVAFDCTFVPVRDGDGGVSGATGVAVDVTARNAAQLALRVGERRFRAMIEKGQDGISLLTADARTLYQSPAVERMIGYTAEQAQEMSWQDFVDPDQQPALHRTLGDLVAVPGSTRHLEFRIRHRDGSRRWLELTATNFLADPDIGALVTNFRDITQRKSLARELDGFFEVSLELLCIAGMDGRFRRLNPAWERALGWSRAELTGRPWLEFVHPDDLEATEREGAKLAAGAVTIEFANRYRTNWGTYRWLQWTCTPLVEDGLIYATAHDVTERRLAREQLILLASIVSSSGDAIFSRGLDGAIRSWNRGAENLTQYTAAEAIGQPVTMLYPADQRAELATVRVQPDGGNLGEQREMVLVRKDGSHVEVSMSSAPLQTETGEVIGASIIARDISERRRGEAVLRRTEEQLLQAQKMEAIGSLAGGVAHDFNNLLTVILSYADMMLEELNPSDPLHADLEQIRQSGVRASVLTRQLLAFSRKQILEPRVLDLNQVVVGVQRMLDRVLGEDIDLSLLTSPRLGRVFADAGQLEQVLMNLVVNARDAMPDGGNLTIETSNADLDASYAEAHVGVTAGAFVLLAVTDTGSGMDRATQARIFEPFFTTKQVGKGTGLGLATVFGIVQQSGGHIWVYSEPAIGTTFKIYLPRVDREVDPQELGVDASRPRGGVETILLVEDDAQVRTIMRSVLRKHGYNVLEAMNGGEAFLVCEQFTATIHLLLTDVVMPHMSGRQLAERLAKLRPAMKVLYVSGYTEDTIVHHGVLDAGIEFLPKPITPDALLAKVRQVLDGRTRRSTRLPP
ncbi:hypothetical protein BH11MYX3_BH11MYX3_15960 [soil metagenome]